MTAQETIKFEIGKEYSTRGFNYVVVDRTACFVKLENKFGEIKRKKVWVSNGVEMVAPEGNYSMCPVLNAEPDMIESIVEEIYEELEEIKEEEVYVSFEFNGFVNPDSTADDYNNTPDHDIKSVHVRLAESYEFEEDHTYTYEEFNEKCDKVLAEYEADGMGGYCKTWITVTFTDGESYEFRLDIDQHEKSIADAFNQRLRYYLVNGPVANTEGERKLAEFWKNFTYRF